MTSFLKSTGVAQEQSAVVFLHRALEQLVGDGGSYHSKVGFKDLRQKPTKYSTLSHAKGQFVVELARLLKNNSPTTRRPGRRTEVQARGAIGIIQPVNEAGVQRLAHTKVSKVVDFRRRSCRSGVSPDMGRDLLPQARRPRYFSEVQKRSGFRQAFQF